MRTYVSMYFSLSRHETLFGNSTSAVVEKLVTLRQRELPIQGLFATLILIKIVIHDMNLI